ncbi:hypothetical protein [Flavobacterium sp.]|jgi:hypothetical protein|uniref:hypothetical protein n=1 Tax=Flavobacterium sp. TaxID=239 RepID=UPI0037BE4EEB
MMKAFQTYIYEINKPYEFRITVANKNPSECLESIKMALDAYQLESISAIKSLPIQEHQAFPKWGACEAWTFDIKVAYPATAAGVRQLIRERTTLHPDWMSVRNLHEQEDTDEAEARGKDHEGALLDEEELKADAGGQELAGQSRIGSLLKELESRKFEFAATGSESGQTTNSAPTGDVSPVGTRQRKG